MLTDVYFGGKIAHFTPAPPDRTVSHRYTSSGSQGSAQPEVGVITTVSNVQNQVSVNEIRPICNRKIVCDRSAQSYHSGTDSRLWLAANAGAAVGATNSGHGHRPWCHQYRCARQDSCARKPNCNIYRLPCRCAGWVCMWFLVLRKISIVRVLFGLQPLEPKKDR